jgi:hypothetical protein
MKTFSKHWVAGLTFMKRLQYITGYKTENKHKCILQNAKPREIQYKILNEENKIWRIKPGHFTVKRKGNMQ